MLRLKCYIESFYIEIILKPNKTAILSEKVKNPVEKSETFSFASSIMKYIAACPAWSRFVVKFICSTAFGSESSACCLLKSVATNYNNFWNNSNLANNQLCNYTLDQLQSFECFNMFLSHFLLADQNVFSMSLWIKAGSSL